MAGYHLNRKTGETGKCEAEQRACPVGSADDHFHSEDEARAAYEVQMSGSLTAEPVRKVRLSIMDRIKGRTEEEIIREQLAAEMAELKAIMKHVFHEDRPVPQLLEAADYYGYRKEEALTVINHAVAIEGKLDKISETAISIVKENPKSFNEQTVDHPYPPRMMSQDWGRIGYEKTTEPILIPGEDTAAHARLKPMLEKLILDRRALQQQAEEVSQEAEVLTKQIQREGNMGADARGLLSERTRELYEEATRDDPSIPAPEVVEDRRTLLTARHEAHRDLTQRGLI